MDSNPLFNDGYPVGSPERSSSLRSDTNLVVKAVEDVNEYSYCSNCNMAECFLEKLVLE